MFDLNLPINGDLSLTPGGDLDTVTGWPLAEQAILRWLFTNPARTLADGTKVYPGYVFNPDFGLGVQSLVGQPFNSAWQASFLQMVKTAVAQQEGVDPNQDPTVSYFQSGRQIFAQISVPTLSNSPQQLTFQVL